MATCEQEYPWLRLKEKEARDNPLLVIIGSQGVGKTTLTTHLNGRAGFQPVFEDFSGLEGPLAELNGYKKTLVINPGDRVTREKAQDLALTLELIFLGRKVLQGEEVRKLSKNGVVLFDVDVLGDFIYVETYRQEGLLRQAQADFYLRQLEIAREVMPVPDLFIGLTVSPEVLVKRIRKRDREFERAIPDSEFQLMATISNSLITWARANNWPILEIDTDRLDYVNNGDHKNAVLAMVLEEGKRLGINLSK